MQDLDSHAFQALYRFAHFAMRDRGKKQVPTRRAIVGWRLLLSGRFNLLEAWLQFILNFGRLTITEDVWWQVLDFANGVRDDLSNYDMNGAWPVLIDEFVVHIHSSRIDIAASGVASDTAALPPPKTGTKRKQLHECVTEQLASRFSGLQSGTAETDVKRHKSADADRQGTQHMACWPPGAGSEPNSANSAAVPMQASSSSPGGSVQVQSGWEGFINITKAEHIMLGGDWHNHNNDSRFGATSLRDLRRCSTEPDASLHGGRTWGESVSTPPCNSNHNNHCNHNHDRKDTNMYEDFVPYQPSALPRSTSSAADETPKPHRRVEAACDSISTPHHDPASRASTCGKRTLPSAGGSASSCPELSEVPQLSGASHQLGPTALPDQNAGKRRSMHGVHDSCFTEETCHDRLANTWQELESVPLRHSSATFSDASSGQKSSVGAFGALANRSGTASTFGGHANGWSKVHNEVSPAESSPIDVSCMKALAFADGAGLRESPVSRFLSTHHLNTSRSPASSDGTVSPGVGNVMRAVVEEGLGFR